MCQEPWCFTPGQIAGLTLTQVRDLYLYPAMDRADDLRRPTAPAATPAQGHDWTKGLPPRAEFVGEQMRRQAEGGQQAGPVRTAEQFGALWDQMAAKLKAAGGN